MYFIANLANSQLHYLFLFVTEIEIYCKTQKKVCTTLQWLSFIFWLIMVICMVYIQNEEPLSEILVLRLFLL